MSCPAVRSLASGRSTAGGAGHEGLFEGCRFGLADARPVVCRDPRRSTGEQQAFRNFAGPFGFGVVGGVAQERRAREHGAGQDQPMRAAELESRRVPGEGAAQVVPVECWVAHEISL